MISLEASNGDVIHPSPDTFNRRRGSMQMQATTEEFLAQLKVDSEVFRELSMDHSATTFDKSGM